MTRALAWLIDGFWEGSRVGNVGCEEEENALPGAQPRRQMVVPPELGLDQAARRQ